MQDLIEKLEKATEPDRELDLAILNVGAEHQWYWSHKPSESITCDRYGHGAIGNPVCGLEYFTDLINDAVRLVPDGLYWMVGFGKRSENEPLGGAGIFRPGEDDPFALGEAATPAIALCIAALKARAALTSTMGTKS